MQLQIAILLKCNHLHLVSLTSTLSRIFQSSGTDLGDWVLGILFLCSVICFVFLLTYLFFGFIIS
jgi:hypothetical protein